jgi:hypothetical protein
MSSLSTVAQHAIDCLGPVDPVVAAVALVTVAVADFVAVADAATTAEQCEVLERTLGQLEKRIVAARSRVWKHEADIEGVAY